MKLAADLTYQYEMYLSCLFSFLHRRLMKPSIISLFLFSSLYLVGCVTYIFMLSLVTASESGLCIEKFEEGLSMLNVHCQFDFLCYGQCTITVL